MLRRHCRLASCLRKMWEVPLVVARGTVGPPDAPSAAGPLTGRGGGGAQVRGPTYLADKRKGAAEGVEMELLCVDLAETPPTYHIAQHLPSVLHSCAPFMFVMQARPPFFPRLHAPPPIQGLGGHMHAYALKDQKCRCS